MRAHLQRIGNSHGIVIPKAFLVHLGIDRTVDVELVDDRLEIRPAVAHPREGWSEALSALPQSAFELTDEDRAWLDLGAPRLD